MNAQAFLACCVWFSAMLVTMTLKVAPATPPVPAVPLNTAPDATVPEPPEPAGDCGSWYDDEECEV